MDSANIVVLAGLFIGLVFGAVGLLSGFCMMSSLRGLWAEGDGRLVRSYALAIGIAIATSQLLAASGLVDRLENLGYVVRSSAREDRRKVMVCITEKGSALVRRIREEMVGNLLKVMTHLTPAEQKAWLQIYTKIYNYCQAKEEPEAPDDKAKKK